MYNQKFGKPKSNPLANVADKLKEGSGLMKQGDLDKDGTLNEYEAKRQAAIDSNSNSAATMYGAPVHMKGGGSQIGHLSGINYGSPVHSKGHGAPEGHVHDTKNPDRYTYQSTDVNAGGKKTRKSRRELAKGMAKAANQGLDVQGYTTSGAKTKVKLKNKKLTVRGKVKGGYQGGQVAGQTELNENVKVKARDIRKQLKKTNTATVKGGVISGGTTQTVTKGGSVKRDVHKANLKTKKENLAKAKTEKIANYKKARLAKQESNVARKAKIQAEKAAKIEARKNSKKS
jgi:hypothetical protein